MLDSSCYLHVLLWRDLRRGENGQLPWKPTMQCYLLTDSSLVSTSDSKWHILFNKGNSWFHTNSEKSKLCRCCRAGGYIFLCLLPWVCATVLTISHFYLIATELATEFAKASRNCTAQQGIHSQKNGNERDHLDSRDLVFYYLSNPDRVIWHGPVSSFLWPWFLTLMKSLGKMFSKVSKFLHVMILPKKWWYVESEFFRQ